MPRLSASVWAEVRLRYERAEESIRDLAAEYGVTHVALWRRAKREGWLRPSEAALLPPDEEKLLGRLFRAFELQIADLELRFVAGEGGGVDERDARMLAVLAKTFETLGKLREGQLAEGEADEGSGDVDVDELCARLARHLDALPPYQGMAGIGAGAGDRGGDEPG